MNCRFCGGPVHDGRDDWPLPDEWQECIRSHRRRIEELERRIQAMSVEEARHHTRLPFEPPEPTVDGIRAASAAADRAWLEFNKGSPTPAPEADRPEKAPQNAKERHSDGSWYDSTDFVSRRYRPGTIWGGPLYWCANCSTRSVTRTDEEVTWCLNCGWRTDFYEVLNATDEHDSDSGILTKAMNYEIAVKEGTLPIPGSEED